jgi:Tol biopolymer transport system component
MSLRRMLGGACGVLALAAIAVSSPEREGPAARLIWQGPEANVVGAPSRDGRWLSFVDPVSGDLAVRDLRAGGTRFVTRKDPKSQAGEFAYFSAISPDGKSVAFAWFNGDRFYDLRVAEIPGAGETPKAPRVLYRNREAGFVQPCAFSPDGKHLVTLFFRGDNISQIALVSVAGGDVRTLKSLNWVYPKRMDISPDGRWIAYDNLAADRAEERDIFVLSADGRRETRLLSGPANDLFPLWSPDGREILFLSDRSGSMGVWAVPVKEGPAAGEPRLLRDGLGRALPLGLTAAGNLYYGLRAGRTDVHLAELGSAEVPGAAIGETPGRNFGAVFSPDGSTLAYLSVRGSENYGLAHRAVLLYSLEQKTSRELPVRLAHVERLAWSPDGRRLLLAGSDRRGLSGLFEYELESGRTGAVVLAQQAGYQGLEGTYAGKEWQIVYIRPGSRDAVVLLHPDNESERVLYEAPPDMSLSAPAVSPDGARVAFAQVERAGGAKGEVLLLALASLTTERLLTLPSGRLVDLAWHPGGDALLVGTEGTSGTHLWRVSAAGDALRPALTAPKRQPGVSVHPNGRSVAVTLGEIHHEIWMLENAARPVTKPRRQE